MSQQLELWIPDKKLNCEPAHVDHLYDGEDPVVAEDSVGALEEHGEGVEGEDDGGHDDAHHREHRDDARPDGGVRLFEQVPHLPFQLTVPLELTFKYFYCFTVFLDAKHLYW